MTARAVDVTISGRVQGVFFRASCVQEARRLSVAGWVRNAPDGKVIGHFEGDADAVVALIDWCHEGPRHARVDDVDVREGAIQHCEGFDVR
ncbi:MAG TPA: acylphosphatase [Flexivirga sp.]|uniref:acylphosphatase n=1 Tax=Flexivirga sp. TaxID=1962927 RepID=UPI002D0B374A|nr:acylphosphatase [Flexivirga sp.]HWC21898.1 acylphosphatase [Flexivirga sp.]